MLSLNKSSHKSVESFEAQKIIFNDPLHFFSSFQLGGNCNQNCSKHQNKFDSLNNFLYYYENVKVPGSQKSCEIMYVNFVTE